MSRSMAQRMQDDEDHRLALCGLTFDVREVYELEDFEVRAHDFQIFASGRRDPAPHDAKRGQGVGGRLHWRSRLGPTPSFTHVTPETPPKDWDGIHNTKGLVCTALS